MTTTERKPQVFVFDLDYTLWPFWVDTHVTPPFSKKSTGNTCIATMLTAKQKDNTFKCRCCSSGVVIDAMGQKVKPYAEVTGILEQLKAEGHMIAIASRTGEVRGAESLINLFGWNNFIDNKQIYPGCKITHFKKIRQALGVEFPDMIFFDDEQRNITDLRGVGVCSVLVKNGVTKELIKQGLKKFASGEL